MSYGDHACPECGGLQTQCCRENRIRLMDHMAACRRIDERDAEVAALKAKLRERTKQVRHLEQCARAAEAHLGRAINWEPRPVDVVRGDAQLAVHALRKPLPKRRRE